MGGVRLLSHYIVCARRSGAFALAAVKPKEE
jgi:hypothetical protein